MEQLSFNLDVRPVGSNDSDNKEKRILIHKLFKPPKNDTNYFYYTEVINDCLVKK
jgi:hypothetical protein